jgi:hypothetical protein
MTQANPADGPGIQTFAKGANILTTDGANLPGRCVRCNAVVNGEPIRMKFNWLSKEDKASVSRAGYVPIVGVVIREVLFYSRRKTAVVGVYLCPRHKVLRYAAWPIALVMTSLALWVPYLTFDEKSFSPLPILAGLLIFATGAGFLVWASRVLRSVFMDANSVILTGACKAFVAELPPDPNTSARP